jgi:hypothetical protein
MNRKTKLLWVVFYAGFLISIGASIAAMVLIRVNRSAFDRECTTLEHDMNDAKIAGNEASKDTVKASRARLDRLGLTREQRSCNVAAVVSAGGIGSMIMLFSVLAITWERRRKRDIAS